MKIKDKIIFIHTAPKECYLAYSGGIDSAVLLHRLLAKKVKVTLITVDHLTEYSEIEKEFCIATAYRYELSYRIIPIQPKSFSDDQENTSKEAYWSRQRDRIFQSICDKKVLTGHHLNDAVEWYVMSSMQGCSKLLNYQNKNVLRPMLIVPRSTIEAYAKRHNVEYITDPTNIDTSFNLRNKIRHKLLPDIQEVFPGIANTVKRMIIKKEFPQSVS